MALVYPHGSTTVEHRQSVTIKVYQHTNPGKVLITFSNGATRTVTLNPYQILNVPLGGARTVIKNMGDTVLEVD